MTAYRVTAPYVTLKVKNHVGQVVLHEFYKDAPVPASADADNVARLLRKGMLAEVDGPELPAPVVVDLEPADEPEMPDSSGAEVRRPHGNASQSAWVAYAVARRPEGVSEEEARAAAEELTKAELVAEYGS